MENRFILVVALCALLGACGGSIQKQDIENKYTNSASQFVHIDGNRIHFRDEGEGVPIIMIHGTASSLHTWDAWSESLKKDYRVIRMDLPGFGLTGPDASDRYEIKHDTQFLSQFLERLGIDNGHFVGSSLGGRIAWQYALDHPEKVATLTLLNALGYPQEEWPPAIEMAQWPVIDTLMEHVSPRFMYEIGLKEVYFEESLVTDPLVDRYFELSRYPGNQAAFPKRVKARLDKDSSLIVGVKVPTFIIWGEEDLYFPVESAHRFHKDISNSQLLIFPGVGHLPMEEVPESSVTHFEEFIRAKSIKEGA